MEKNKIKKKQNTTTIIPISRQRIFSQAGSHTDTLLPSSATPHL